LWVRRFVTGEDVVNLYAGTVGAHVLIAGLANWTGHGLCPPLLICLLQRRFSASLKNDNWFVTFLLEHEKFPCGAKDGLLRFARNDEGLVMVGALIGRCIGGLGLPEQ
jgi:hypothetical protein